jgi:hypothetical protein
MLDYGYLKKYIGGVRAEGRYTFSLAGIRARFPQSDEAIKKALQRLKNKQEIVQVRKEFYVILPPEYKSRGMLPPAMFIDDLMKFLGRDYYVGLQDAAAFLGTASQQSTDFSVVTTKPPLRAIQTINFNSKKEWSKDDIDQLEVETGYINVSSPELTALDLLFFMNKEEWFDHIAAVLEGLSYTMNAQKLVATANRFPQISTVQRLGFLLDEVLQMQSLSDPLAEYLKTVNYFPVVLFPEKIRPVRMITGNKWKVVTPPTPSTTTYSLPGP